MKIFHLSIPERLFWSLVLWNQAVDVQQALLIFQHHNKQEDKIRPLVENHRRLKDCCRKKNHDDEDAGAGVYNLIVDQMASKRLRKRDVKGIVGTMNLMVTVLAVAVLSELTNAASMRVT
jgi:hypothetical protein